MKIAEINEEASATRSVGHRESELNSKIYAISAESFSFMGDVLCCRRLLRLPPMLILTRNVEPRTRRWVLVCSFVVKMFLRWRTFSVSFFGCS